ncbi:D-Ala-D-Ala carboxypeptidase family metallohydrolase [Eubacteriaceae bacterium ES2]|nr:D-Ala-D-Ala carboxypeptidase family metallohydrolase [Eubacteriaceae bacterium ES2]
MLGVEYKTYLENLEWQEIKRNGEIAGTIGESRRIEAIEWHLIDKPEGEEIFLHGNPQLENLGWTGFVAENELCGTTGQARKLEGIQFQLVGADADKYSVQYRIANAQNIGKMGWAKDGELAGTEGAGLRAEAIQILITEKGVDLSTYESSFQHFDPDPVVEETEPVATGRLGLRYFDEDKDFKCPCGCGLDVIDEVKIMADNARHEYGHPLYVSSGARCPTQNAKDGGITNSNHIKGQAVDMYSPGRMSYSEVNTLANVMRNNGFGCILYHENLFVHGDLDGEFWSMN